MTLALHHVQALAHAFDGRADHAPVELNLGLSRATAHALPTALSLKVAPAAHQARGKVLQPGQFHLQLTLVAARALREDVENQQGTVVDRRTQVALKVTLLGWAQRLIKKHLLRLVLLQALADFVGLAPPHKQRRVRRATLAHHALRDLVASALRQQGKFVQTGVEVG